MDIVPFTAEFDVSGFTCGDDPDYVDLNDFLKNDALRYARTSMGQTSVAVEDGVVLGYVTLVMDAIWLTPQEKEEFQRAAVPTTRTIPALKVGRLARHVEHRSRGLGPILMRFAFDEMMAMSNRAGCRLLSVDAIPRAVSFYERLGFVRNHHNNHMPKKGSTTSMRFDAFAVERPNWTK